MTIESLKELGYQSHYLISSHSRSLSRLLSAHSNSCTIWACVMLSCKALRGPGAPHLARAIPFALPPGRPFPNSLGNPHERLPSTACLPRLALSRSNSQNETSLKRHFSAAVHRTSDRVRLARSPSLIPPPTPPSGLPPPLLPSLPSPQRGQESGSQPSTSGRTTQEDARPASPASPPEASSSDPLGELDMSRGVYRDASTRLETLLKGVG